MPGRIEHHYTWHRHHDGTLGLRCAHCATEKLIDGQRHLDISATTSDDMLRSLCTQSLREHARVCAKLRRVMCPPTPRSHHNKRTPQRHTDEYESA